MTDTEHKFSGDCHARDLHEESRMSHIYKSVAQAALASVVTLGFVASCLPEYADAATAKSWASTANQAITAFEDALPNDKVGIAKCKAIIGKFSDSKAHTTIRNVNPYVKIMVFTGASRGYGYGCVAYPVAPTVVASEDSSNVS